MKTENISKSCKNWKEYMNLKKKNLTYLKKSQMGLKMTMRDLTVCIF